MDFDLSEALTMTLGGAGMAFLVLASLALLTAAMGQVSTRHDRKREPERLTAVQPSPPLPEGDDASLAAAIAVAVAMAESWHRGAHTAGRTVTPRTTPASSWALRGRQDIMGSRLGSSRRR